MSKDKYYQNHTIEVLNTATPVVTIGTPTTNPNDLFVTGDLIVTGSAVSGAGDLLVDGDLTVTGNGTINGDFTVNDDTTFGNLSTDNHTFNGKVTFEDGACWGPSGRFTLEDNAGSTAIISTSALAFSAATDAGLIAGTTGTAYIYAEPDEAGLYVGKTSEVTWDDPFTGVTVKGDPPNDFLVRIENDGTDTDTSGIRLNIGTSLNTSNKWIRFDSGTGNQKGKIRGTNSASATAFKADGSDGGGTVNAAGECVFASGASDFGEWVRLGDINEWGVSREESLVDINGRLGLPEGWIVYVRDKTFWKEAPGTPMVITHRALVVGNERDRDPEYIGEILSFMGQVPVLVEGKVDTGDFLIPAGSSFCIAKSPADITFQEYLSAIGTAWEGKDDEGRSRILCAVGVKSICS